MVASLINGVLTERLGNGLQNRVERFDSARHLFRKKEIHSFEFPFFFVYTPLTPESAKPVCPTRPERACGNKTILQGAYEE